MNTSERAEIFAKCKCLNLIKEKEILRCKDCGFLRSNHSMHKHNRKLSKKDQ